MAARQYDIIVWGATGYSGRLVTDYLAHSKDSFTFAIAGRDAGRLGEIKAQLEGRTDKKIDILVADAKSEKDLANIASKTKVVIACVGPFALHGEPILKSCIANGTDYVDITGEPTWVSDMLAKYEQEAIDKKVRIINNSGFDSVPSDMGTFYAIQELKKRGSSCRMVHCFWTGLKGGASGGTIATVFNMLDNPSSFAKAQDIYLLNPAAAKPSAPKNEEKDIIGVTYNKELGVYTAPFIMAAANTRIVRRSAALYALEGSPYGANFCYNESMGFKGVCQAITTSAAIVGGFLAGKFQFFRNLAKKYVPKQGEGPSAEKRANSHFRVDYVAYGEEKDKVLIARLRGKDGYDETAHYTSESALALALERSSLPPRYGFVTPAFGLGNVLLQRLQKTGSVFEVLSSN